MTLIFEWLAAISPALRYTSYTNRNAFSRRCVFLQPYSSDRRRQKSETVGTTSRISCLRSRRIGRLS